MDVLPPPPELSSDIQRAIQQAVGQANDAFINHQVNGQPETSKRKRKGDSIIKGGDAMKQKKKKAPEAAQTSPQGSSASTAHRINAQPKRIINKVSSKPNTPSTTPSTQVAPNLADTNHSLVPSPLLQPQSPDAFLDAVVSAASATGAPSETPYNFSSTCFDPSPYSAIPTTLPLNTTAFQPPDSFSNVTVPDLDYASNDDILHALQDLDVTDVTKIASVLKTLGEAAAAANVPTSLPSTLLRRPQPATSNDSTPPSSVSMAECHVPPAPQHDRHLVDLNTHRESVEHSDHAELLATKWLSAQKLAELAKIQGLVYKKGKFSTIEEQQLSNAIQMYKEENRIDDAGFINLVFAKDGNAKNTAFWSALTAAVPMRPIIAVYHHVRRAYHPLRAQGKWMPTEDALLKAAVQELGQQWEKVSERVGRMASDCRDRYRNHIQNSEDRTAGPWKKEEEIRLTQIVTDMTVKQGKDMDNDVFWSVVSQRMGGKRGRQQCRIKWTDCLSKTFKNNGTKPRWSSRDAYILVHKVDSLHVRDDSEIDWKTLPDPNWNLWSAHTLQRRWLTMKRSVRGYEDMTHTDILDILRQKKLDLPGSRSRAVVSAEAVEDSDDADNDDV